ncbi:hypothetical protein AB0E85_25175 [Streptomyces sp. NPDC029044]|uniref:hypothetical protein n=1 Tax=Streptomyces sp. NPDC029044 TaxID=3157198 RepID=UPI0033EE4AAA
MRRAAVLLLGLCPLWPAAPASAAERAPAGRAPTGWASAGPGTTGGAGGGRTWTVDTRAELKAALTNDGEPTELGLGGDVGWNPARRSDHRVLTSPTAVERYVLRHAGAGRPHERP